MFFKRKGFEQMIVYCYKRNYNFNLQINDILDNIDREFDMQKNQLSSLLSCLKKINKRIEKINNIDENNEISEFLTNLEKNSTNLQNNLLILEKLKDIILKISEYNCEDKNNLNKLIKNYNVLAKKYNIYFYEDQNNINQFLFSYMQNSGLDSLRKTEEKFEYAQDKITNKEISENDKFKVVETNVLKDNKNKNIEKQELINDLKDNDTLVISEKSGKVYLPYKVEKVRRKFRKSKYRNIQELINSEYILDISMYKNPSISRYKEAYKLMRKKEHSSVLAGIELGMEMMFYSNLNPAIISACNNLTELDNYLDCLDSNKLDKFNLFKIRYEVTPTKNVNLNSI